MAPRRSHRLRALLLGAGLLLLLVAARGTHALLVRHESSGLVLTTVPVGQGPRFGAIDGRTEHAFVVDQGGAQSATVTTTGAGASLVTSASRPADISMIDLRDGALVRTITLTTDPTGIAVDERHGRAIVIGAAGLVPVLDTTTGALVATPVVAGGADTLSVDAVSGRAVAVSYTAGTASTIDTRTGRLLRVVRVGQGAVGVLVDEQTHRAFVESRPGGYGTDARGSIGVLDTTSGALLRRVIVGLSPDGMALAAGEGRVYVLNGQDGTVSVLDVRSGALVRTIALTAGGFPSGPGTIVVDERTHRAFVDHGWIHVFDTRTGAIVALHKVSTVPGPLGLDVHTQRVFAATYRDGHIRMLDGASGRLLRTIDVGIAPQDLEVDDAARRVYVVIPGPVLATAPPGAVGPTYTRGPGRVWVLDARSGAVLERTNVGMAPVGVVTTGPSLKRALVLNMAGLVRAPDPWAWVPTTIRRHAPFIPPPPQGFTSVNGSVSILDTSR